MSGYTKLFASIVSSTVWREDDKTRIVWVTMLAMRDKYHIVEASIPGLADFAKVSLQDCEKALSKLSSPDPYSRTEEFEGRRIQKVEAGWLILNGEKYMNKMSQDDRREANRIYQQRSRERKKAVSNLSDESDKSAKSAHKDKDKYKDEHKEAAHAAADAAAAEPEIATRVLARSQFPAPSKSKPVDQIPIYDKLPPTRDPSQEERDKILAIAKEEKEKLRLRLLTG